MKGLIFKTNEEAKQELSNINKLVGKLFDKKTTSYSYIMKHPSNNLWAIPIDDCKENCKYYEVIKKQYQDLKPIDKTWYENFDPTI